MLFSLIVVLVLASRVWSQNPPTVPSMLPAPATTRLPPALINAIMAGVATPGKPPVPMVTTAARPPGVVAAPTLAPAPWTTPKLITATKTVTPSPPSSPTHSTTRPAAIRIGSTSPPPKPSSAGTTRQSTARTTPRTAASTRAGTTKTTDASTRRSTANAPTIRPSTMKPLTSRTSPMSRAGSSTTRMPTRPASTSRPPSTRPSLQNPVPLAAAMMVNQQPPVNCTAGSIWIYNKIKYQCFGPNDHMVGYRPVACTPKTGIEVPIGSFWNDTQFKVQCKMTSPNAVALHVVACITTNGLEVPVDSEGSPCIKEIESERITWQQQGGCLHDKKFYQEDDLWLSADRTYWLSCVLVNGTWLAVGQACIVSDQRLVAVGHTATIDGKFFKCQRDRTNITKATLVQTPDVFADNPKAPMPRMNDSLGMGLAYPRCQSGNYTFSSIVNWKIGGIRDYYVARGTNKTLSECQADCAATDDCYAATVTATSKCYFLVASSTHACRYELAGHFGPMLEPCTADKPCPSVYKRCGKPDCFLQRMVIAFCTNDAMDPQAVLRCNN